MARTILLSRSNPQLWLAAAGGLLLAAAVVGAAITLGGSAARALNSAGALVWLGSAALVAISLPEPARRAAGWVAALAGALLLGAVVRPGDVLEVVVWFAAVGAIVVLVAGDRSGAWALVVPAIYLPVHLLIGIGRAFLRNGGVRTEPPPTAAIVPLAMIVAAGMAGALVATFFKARRAS